MMVCPDCGNEDFKTTLTTRTEYTYAFDGFGHLETASEVVDGDDVGDADGFTCTDCGASYGCPEQELITREQYESGGRAID